jgi:hypothetical protein
LDAAAYVNWGRWVADCPRWPGCSNAAELEEGQEAAHCEPPAGCGAAYRVIWPADAAQIWAALEQRPSPQTRNWYPAGHDRAAAYGLPAGETPAGLQAETAAHSAATRREEIMAALAGAGLRINADGTVEGL